MPADTTSPDWFALLGRAETAVRMVPPRPRPGSLPGRVWARLRAAAGRLFSSRQDRFNAELAGLVRDLCDLVRQAHQRVPQVDALWEEVASVRRDLLAVVNPLARDVATIGKDVATAGRGARAAADTAQDMSARLAHVEQHTREMARLAAAERADLIARLNHLEQYVRVLNGADRANESWPAAPFKQAG